MFELSNLADYFILFSFINSALFLANAASFVPLKIRFTSCYGIVWKDNENAVNEYKVV